MALSWGFGHTPVSKGFRIMKKSYRIAQESNYIRALNQVGVKATAEHVTVHRDGSATVVGVTEKALTRVMKIPGVEVLKTGKLEVTISIPAAVAYHEANPPFITPEEKAAEEAAKLERAANRVSKSRPALELDEEDGEE
jgi:outer membrane protein assembly factor BamA